MSAQGSVPSVLSTASGAVDNTSISVSAAVDSIVSTDQDMGTALNNDNSGYVFSDGVVSKEILVDKESSKTSVNFPTGDNTDNNCGKVGSYEGIADVNDCTISPETVCTIGDDQKLTSTIMTLLGMSNDRTRFHSSNLKTEKSHKTDCPEIHFGTAHNEEIECGSPSPCVNENKNERTEKKTALESASALVSEAKGEGAHTSTSQRELESCAISIVHENMLRLQENITINQVANVLASLDSSKNTTLDTDPDSSSSFPPNLSMLEQLASVAMNESQACEFSQVTNKLGEIRLECVSPVAQSFLKDFPFVLPSPVPAGKSSSSLSEEGSYDFVGNTPPISRKGSHSARSSRQKQLKCTRNAPTADIDGFSDDSADTILEFANESTIEEDKVTIRERTIEGENISQQNQNKAKNIRNDTDLAKTRGSHSCSVCAKRFTLARLLSSHMKKDHSSENKTTTKVDKLNNDIVTSSKLPVALEDEKSGGIRCAAGKLDDSHGSTEDTYLNPLTKRPARRTKSVVSRSSGKMHDEGSMLKNGSSELEGITCATRSTSQSLLLDSSRKSNDEIKDEKQNAERRVAQVLLGSRAGKESSKCHFREQSTGSVLIGTGQLSEGLSDTSVKEMDASSDISHQKKQVVPMRNRRRRSHLPALIKETRESTDESTRSFHQGTSFEGIVGEVPILDLPSGHKAIDNISTTIRSSQSSQFDALAKEKEKPHDPNQVEVHKGTDQLIGQYSQLGTLVEGTREAGANSTEVPNFDCQITTRRQSQSVTIFKEAEELNPVKSVGTAGNMILDTQKSDGTATNAVVTRRRRALLATSHGEEIKLTPYSDINEAQECNFADESVSTRSHFDPPATIKRTSEIDPADVTASENVTDHMVTTRRRSQLAATVRNADETISGMSIEGTNTDNDTDLMVTTKGKYQSVKPIPGIGVVGEVIKQSEDEDATDQVVNTRRHSQLGRIKRGEEDLISNSSSAEEEIVADQMLTENSFPASEMEVEERELMTPVMSVTEKLNVTSDSFMTPDSMMTKKEASLRRRSHSVKPSVHCKRRHKEISVVDAAEKQVATEMVNKRRSSQPLIAPAKKSSRITPTSQTMTTRQRSQSVKPLTKEMPKIVQSESQHVTNQTLKVKGSVQSMNTLAISRQDKLTPDSSETIERDTTHQMMVSRGRSRSRQIKEDAKDTSSETIAEKNVERPQFQSVINLPKGRRDSVQLDGCQTEEQTASDNIETKSELNTELIDYKGGSSISLLTYPLSSKQPINTRRVSKVDKPKEEENNERIADSIRNKIQKLLAGSETNSDLPLDPNDPNSPSHSIFTTTEAIGKRQPKATLKKKAFMEELQTLKSRRKRIKIPLIPPSYDSEIEMNQAIKEANVTALNEGVDSVSWENKVTEESVEISGMRSENQKYKRIVTSHSASKKDSHCEEELSSNLDNLTRGMNRIEPSKPTDAVNPLEVMSTFSEKEVRDKLVADQEMNDIRNPEKQQAIKLENNLNGESQLEIAEQEKGSTIEVADKKRRVKSNKALLPTNQTKVNKAGQGESQTKAAEVTIDERKLRKSDMTYIHTKMKDAVSDVDVDACQSKTCARELTGEDTEKNKVNDRHLNSLSGAESNEIIVADIIPSSSPSFLIDNKTTVKEVPIEIALDNIVKSVITSPPHPRKYKCKICSSEFLKEQELSKHSLKHSTQRTYDCYKCSEKLTTMRALTKHLLVHDELASSTSTSRSHDCDICGYQCETENQLIVHKKVHEAKHMEHACALCSMKYHHLTELYAHISKFHPEGMQEILRCSHCNESVSNFDLFRKHLTAIHGMNAKQAAVASKNKGVLPEEYRKVEEERQEILRERKRIKEEKKQALVAKRNAKGFLLRSGLLKVDKKRNVEKTVKTLKLAATPVKKGVISKAKAVVRRSRRMKRNLRRDAVVAPLESSNLDDCSSEKISSIKQCVSNISKIPSEEHKVLKTEGTEVGIMQNSSLIDMPEEISLLLPTTKSVLVDAHIEDKSFDVIDHPYLCQKESYEPKAIECVNQNDISSMESTLPSFKKTEMLPYDQNKHLSVPRRDPDLELVRKAEAFLRRVSKCSKQVDTLLPIEVLEKIYQRVHAASLNEPNRKIADLPRETLDCHRMKRSIKSSSKSNIVKDNKLTSKSAMKNLSQKTSKETLTSPKYSILQKEDGCEEALQLTWKDELKLNIRSPKYCGSTEELPEVNPVVSPGTSKRSAEETELDHIDEEQKQIRLKFESAERMARMLVRNQRRTNDGSSNHKKTKKLDMKDELRCEAYPDLIVEKIEPLKVKVHVKMNKFDSQTTATVVSSHPSSAISSCTSNTNEMEISRKNKRKAKRKSSRGSSRKSSPDSNRSQKLRKSDKDATSQEIATECSISKQLNTPIDDDHRSSETQQGESETESLFLLPGGIDFDKEYDYKNQTKAKTLTEDDLLSSLMTLADCAVDAHMMNDSQNDVTDLNDDVKYQNSEIAITVLEKVQELIDLVCQQGYIAFDNSIDDTLGHHSDYSETPVCLNEQKSCCFTPNPTLDHDYFGNFDEDMSNNLLTCTKRRRVYSETSAGTNVRIPRRNMSSMSGSGDFLLDKDLLCLSNAPKQINTECSDLEKNARLLQVRSSTPEHDGISQRGNRLKNLQLNDLSRDKSIVDFLSESLDSAPLQASGSNKLKMIPDGENLEDIDYHEVENWQLLHCSPGPNEYNSNTIIKTEDDVFDIDVQANDLNDIIEFNEPFEEINNNTDETGSDTSIIGTDMCKVYSCDNEVDFQDLDSSCLRTDNSKIPLPLVTRTVSDLIGHINGTFYCKYCRKQFRKETSVKQHSLTHLNSLKHPFKCLDCSSSFSKCSDYIRHKAIHLPGTEIGEHSIRNSNHSTRLHSLDKKSGKTCLLCPMIFADMSAYKLHLREYHKIWDNRSKGMSMRNACSKCNLVFMNRKTLIRHDKFVHGQLSNNNTCSICGRTFLKSLYLKSHIRTHRGIYPFRCSHCNQAFHFRYQLYRHLKRHKIKLKEA